MTKTGLTLTVGQTYYFSVKAINGVGLTGNATNSNGQTVVADSTPPSAPPTVRDGTGADIDAPLPPRSCRPTGTPARTTRAASAATNMPSAPRPAAHKRVNWTSLGNVTTVTKTGLTLSVGQTYYFSVQGRQRGTDSPATPRIPTARRSWTSHRPERAGQRAGWNAERTSRPPVPPRNCRPTGTPVRITRAASAATSTPSAPRAGGTQTVNWTSLGNVTTVTKTGLTLSVGQTYYFSVKAVNGAGLTGNATNSNGQTVVDITPPSAPPAVRDGTGADISTTSSTTQLVGQLGRQHGYREWHQRLPVRHRHLGRRNANGQLDLAGQRNDRNQDRIDVDGRPDLLSSVCRPSTAPD